MDKYFEIHTYALNIFKKNMSEIIAKYSDAGRKIVMFGTSIIAEIIVEYLKNTALDISFIVDNDKKGHGEEVYGKTVYSPEKLKEDYNSNYLIFIASSYQDEMISQLESYGYKMNEHIIKVIDLPELMSDYSYVDRSGYVQLTREQVKESQLGILNKIETCSEKFGIKYYLQSGTALGAVRHGGYIPWDDDVDVFIPIDDYLRMIDILKDDNDYGIISQFNTDCYFGWGFGYMIDKNTICDINKFPIQLTSGQSIDLFPLYGLPEDKEEFDVYVKKAKRLEVRCLTALSEKDRKKAIDEFNQFLLSYKYSECSKVGNILMPLFLKDVYDKTIFGDGVYAKFENLRLRIPEQYDKYLTHMYGNYMELPPEDKRVGEHFYHTYYA